MERHRHTSASQQPCRVRRRRRPDHIEHTSDWTEAELEWITRAYNEWHNDQGSDPHLDTQTWFHHFRDEKGYPDHFRDREFFPGLPSTFFFDLAMAGLPAKFTRGARPARPPKPTPLTNLSPELPKVAATRISPQKQARHVLGPKWTGGGFFDDASQAQRVLDAYHRGDTTVLGVSKTGQIVVEYVEEVGYHVHRDIGIHAQRTSVFKIKGTTRVSVFPADPTLGGGL